VAPALVHLDTSFLIRALVASSPESALLATWLGESALIGMSAVAWAEFLCGPVSDSQAGLARDVLGEAVALTGDDAVLAARLFNRAGRRRGTLVDCLIAATAIRTGAELATANRADFLRLRAAELRLA
jgi:predicted nucleic acid-binding protein